MIYPPIFTPCAPEAGDSVHLMSEAGENRLWFARHLVKTLNHLSCSGGADRELQMPQESLSATFYLLSELLDFDTGYESRSHRAESEERAALAT
ncbi:MAG: hypothetical protein LBU53_07230 [Zoogloeaceae bacterium]|jgi:hypothetical protein|nr:hypothetical protein [Zoogloeaceae bacterium]